MGYKIIGICDGCNKRKEVIDEIIEMEERE